MATPAPAIGATKAFGTAVIAGGTAGMCAHDDPAGPVSILTRTASGTGSDTTTTTAKISARSSETAAAAAVVGEAANIGVPAAAAYRLVIAEVHVVVVTIPAEATNSPPPRPAPPPPPGSRSPPSPPLTDSPHVVQVQVAYCDIPGIDEEAALLVEAVKREIAAVDGHTGPARQVECQQVRGQADVARDVDDVVAGGCGIDRRITPFRVVVSVFPKVAPSEVTLYSSSS